MISNLVTLSVERRWLVLLLTTAAALLGIFALQRLPIDAVPDITNNQVQVNVLAPSLSPDQIERQVSFTIETSLAGIPGLEYTRSLIRLAETSRSDIQTLGQLPVPTASGSFVPLASVAEIAIGDGPNQISREKPSTSTFMQPNRSMSSLSHSMTCRSSIAAGSIGTSSSRRSRVSTKPPGCWDRWRGVLIS